METLETLRQYCSANERVVPMPQEWSDLYKMLHNTVQRPSGGWTPPLPLILAAWGASGEAKKERLTEHLQWAENEGQLDEISEFLRSLPEDKWFHTIDI